MAIPTRSAGRAAHELRWIRNTRNHLVAFGNFFITSSYFFSPDNNPITTQPSYWNVNARIGIRSSDLHYGIYLDVENVFNKAYFAFGSSYGNPDGTDHAANVYGTPRVIKGTVELHF